MELTLSKSPCAFSMTVTEASIFEALKKEAILELNRRRTALVAERNILSFQHGTSWESGNSPDAGRTEFFEQSVETSASIRDAIDHKVSLLDEFAKAIVDGLDAKMKNGFFHTLGETAEMTITPANLNSFADFLDLLETLQYSCDEWGRASPPTIYGSPVLFQRLEMLDSAATEQERMRHLEIQKRQEERAVAKETERLSRYKWEPK
jgi:hypothetical protein